MTDLPRIRIDRYAHQVWLGDQRLTLSELQFGLLAHLADHVGQAVTRQQIMKEVWGTDLWAASNTLDMQVSYLRRKLGDDAASPRYIATVRGIGFRLEAGTVDQPEPPQAEAEEAATRVLLVKPGDVLVFGNLGTVPDPERTHAAVADLRDQLRLASVVLFAGDINMAAVPAGSVGG